MIFERDGKFFKQETFEKEITELEYLREKVSQLELQVNSIPRYSLGIGQIYSSGCGFP
jgi:hypothetical protein